MNTVILGGPVLGQTAVSSRYYSILNTDSLSHLATIEINIARKTRILTIHSPDGDEDTTAAILRLLMAVVKTSPEPIAANDTSAIVLAHRLSAVVDSRNADIIKGWTSLDFVIEFTNESGTHQANKVRFQGTGIAGIKAITKASSVLFTITAK
jgi:hypothetical protein